MRRISLVAARCSWASRISRACAAMVFFSFATESGEDTARGFALIVFEIFLAIRAHTNQPNLNVKIRNPNIEIRNKPEPNKPQISKTLPSILPV